MCFRIELATDLSRKMAADMQELVGVGEHVGQRWTEFEAGRNALRFELRGEETHGGLEQ